MKEQDTISSVEDFLKRERQPNTPQELIATAIEIAELHSRSSPFREMVKYSTREYGKLCFQTFQKLLEVHNATGRATGEFFSPKKENIKFSFVENDKVRVITSWKNTKVGKIYYWEFWIRKNGDSAFDEFISETKDNKTTMLLPGRSAHLWKEIPTKNEETLREGLGYLSHTISELFDARVRFVQTSGRWQGIAKALKRFLGSVIINS